MHCQALIVSPSGSVTFTINFDLKSISLPVAGEMKVFT